MNRYPVWKYAIIVIALLVGFLYTLPNFFGEAPAVQVSSVKTAVKVDIKLLGRVEEVGESFVTLEIAQGVRIKVQKHALGAVLPKGTYKSA